MATDSKVLGVVLLTRHGDRQGFYQSETTYTPSQTSITPLGNKQSFDLGTELRALYLTATSPSYIQNISTGLFKQSQVSIRADAGGEGGVIYDSAVSLVAGLWPATNAWNTTLANGTTIVAPLSGYQVVPVTSVDPNLDVSLEGFTACPTFNNATSAFYNSTAFQQKAKENAVFLNSLSPYLDGRPVTLQNMWNIFDYMNVEFIHNATFSKRLPATYLEQARDLANWHEYNVFSSPNMTGPGNIAGRTVIPSILQGIASSANASMPVKFTYQAISYKPFISLFNMTGAAMANPQLAGVVNFAAAIALEVRQPNSGGSPVIRFNFKNGSEDVFRTYNFMNTTGDVPIDKFVSFLTPLGVNGTSDWCTACSNTQERGCPAALALAQASSATQYNVGSHEIIGPLGAGFLGAGVTLVVVAAVLGALAFLGIMTFGKRGGKRRPAMSEK